MLFKDSLLPASMTAKKRTSRKRRTGMEKKAFGPNKVAREHIGLSRLEELGLRTRIVPRGNGLTKRDIKSFRLSDLADLADMSPEAADLAKEVLAQARPTIWEQLDGLKTRARRKLQEMGLPDSDNAVAVMEDGSWKSSSFNSTNRRHRRIVAGLEMALTIEESPGWFAAQTLRLIEEIGAQGKKSPKALAAAFGLGRLVEREWWKIKHEAVAISGHRAAENRNLGRKLGTEATKANGSLHYETVVAQTNALWTSKPNLKKNISETARRIEAKKLDELQKARLDDFLKVDAIRRLIKRGIEDGRIR